MHYSFINIKQHYQEKYETHGSQFINLGIYMDLKNMDNFVAFCMALKYSWFVLWFKNYRTWDVTSA